ncbi:MAG: EAL domain-containing protein [Desulfobulbaceae bacterium]|nr:EAL domain-containing protein [Desulfobulbaceae bacterium]
MDIFVARQPIFSRQKKLFAYELLHRGSMKNVFPGTDGDKATSSVLVNTFLSIGLDKLVGPKWAFINFTEQHLLAQTPVQFPPEKVIVEILEHVLPTPEIINGCKQLKENGYILALDDFIFDDNLEPLVEIADIIKVDFQDVAVGVIQEKVKALREKKIKLLAEKIETYSEFDAARKMGFSYFQGYFFSRPEVLKNREISSSKINLLALLSEVNRKKINLKKIEKMMAPDVAISYKLLRYINSAYYYLLNEVKSLHHALIYLGEEGVRQFVSLVATSELSADKPDELIRTAIIRARLSELLGGYGSIKQDTSVLFLVGLFSLLDAMLDVSMQHIVEQLPLSGELKDALVEQKGPLASYLKTVISYEQGNWTKCSSLLGEIGVDGADMLSGYLDAVEWADLFAEGKVGSSS